MYHKIVFMKGYLLLRDNKQTGPYSLEEIIEKGFKPYDLIWAEGKSAGWRYPGELPEFALIAPMVEEQPFDRFFKKTPSVSSSVNMRVTTEEKIPAIKKESIVSIQTDRQILKATIEVPSEIVHNEINEPQESFIRNEPRAKVINLSSGKVFVTLPGNSIVPQSIPSYERMVANREPFIESEEAIREKSTPALNNEPMRQEKKQVVAETKYSSYSQDRMETHKIPGEQQTSYPNSKRYRVRSLFMGAVAASLLLGGVIIGLLISNSKQSEKQDQLNSIVKQIKERESSKKTSITPESPVLSNEKQQQVNEPLVSEENFPQAGNIQKPKQEIPDKPGKTESLPSAKNSEPSVISVVQKNLPNEPVSKDEHSVKQEKEDGSVAAKQNIYSLVFVEGSSYKTGVLGGISDLRLTISNNSLYPIDQVEVLINYMNIEKRIVKKETLLINDVAAGEQKTIPVPKSKRGVSVSYTITKINSRALGLAHAGL